MYLSSVFFSWICVIAIGISQADYPVVWSSQEYGPKIMLKVCILLIQICYPMGRGFIEMILSASEMTVGCY